MSELTPAGHSGSVPILDSAEAQFVNAHINKGCYSPAEEFREAVEHMPKMTQDKLWRVREAEMLRCKAKQPRLYSQRAAWEELDALEIPQRTFSDSRGLPAYTILADGSKCFPSPSAVGKTIEWIDDADVDAQLNPLCRSGTVTWDGVIPQEERGMLLNGEEGIGGDVAGEKAGDFQEGEPRTASEGVGTQVHLGDGEAGGGYRRAA